jgi:hypothetical protein
MLKLPFFNRKNYILLKCYTNVHTIAHYSPIVLSAKAESEVVKNNPNHALKRCYGHILGLKNSITIRSWSEFTVSVTEETANYTFPEDNPSDVKFHNDEDSPAKDAMVSKLISPWVISTESDCKFVMASHMLNATGMIIPSGIVNYNTQHQTNIFNYVRKVPHTYTVPFKTPLVMIYPISDKKIQLEVYQDLSTYDALVAKDSYRPYLRASAIKMAKLDTL